ncbi:MAG: hydroxysqualene synthase [Alphaproteobacteria bacterium]|nr:hydroxysqualene synthase [Alphaproteobacteria bacterium]
MRTPAELSSGKGHRDENFPVASWIIHPRHRAIILSFYRFARAADDIADHSSASPKEKLDLLDQMQRTLLGQSETVPESASLRTMLAAHRLSLDHPLDLLEAFRRDVTKLRYRDWDDLIDYCRVSAMPVGRFVLDVHGESRGTWPASDALCSALQIINHLQDCAADYRNLDRVYIPVGALREHGIGPEALGAPRASPALLAVIADLTRQTSELLLRAKPFAHQIRDRRLALEVSVIQALAEDLARGLVRRDPLCERVHHSKSDVARLAIFAAARFIGGGFRSRLSAPEIAERRR